MHFEVEEATATPWPWVTGEEGCCGLRFWGLEVGTGAGWGGRMLLLLAEVEEATP